MLISIITINYNDKVGLENAIKSVENQTYKHVEHIVIDGNSTDGSKTVIENNKNHLSYSISEPDTGVYNAMNKGIKAAKGEYVLFLNSGDIFFNPKVLENFKLHINKNIDIIYGDILVAGTPDWVKTYPDVLSFQYLLNDSLPHPATLIKKQCFNNFLYDETLKIASDWKFFIIGICKNKFSYLHIDKVISKFHLDGISSNNPNLVTNERQKVIKEEFNLFIEDYKKLTELEAKNNKTTLKRKIKKFIKKAIKKK